MRIYYDSMTLPKKAARRIQKFYSSSEFLKQAMPLHEAQAIAAWMLGYDDWHELEQTTKSLVPTPSLLDEDADAQTQEARIQYQTSALQEITPLTMPPCRALAFQFRVSGKNPLSKNFAVDLYSTNELIYDAQFEEWRFMPSIRSKAMYEVMYELSDKCQAGQLTFWQYEMKTFELCDRYPEAFVPYIYLLYALGKAGHWEKFAKHLPEFEKRVSTVFPENFPTSKRTLKPLEWGSVDSRDFLRSLYALGLAHYIGGNYQAGKKWLLTSKRCASIVMGEEDALLADMRSNQPKGDLHLNLV